MKKIGTILAFIGLISCTPDTTSPGSNEGSIYGLEFGASKVAIYSRLSELNREEKVKKVILPEKNIHDNSEFIHECGLYKKTIISTKPNDSLYNYLVIFENGAVDSIVQSQPMENGGAIHWVKEIKSWPDSSISHSSIVKGEEAYSACADINRIMAEDSGKNEFSFYVANKDLKTSMGSIMESEDNWEIEMNVDNGFKFLELNFDQGILRSVKIEQI